MAATASIGYGTVLQVATNTTTPVYASIAFVRSISGPQVDTDEVECTAFDSPNNYREFLLSLIDPGEMTFELVWDPDAQSHVDLTTYQAARQKLAWKMILPTTVNTITVLGYVKSLGPEIPLDDVMTMPVTIRLTGAVTWPTTV